MKKFLLFFPILLLASCGQFLEEKSDQIIEKPDIVVLPHHGITGANIDDFYKKISEKNPNYQRIVIISPDHFGKIQTNIESSPQNLKKWCFQDFCVPLKSLEKYNTEKSKIFRENGNIFEHGLGEHFHRISRFLPNIPVTPVIVRRSNIETFDEKLIQNLTELAKTEKILFILSVDFSHHVREDIAILHDKMSEQVLNYWEKNDFAKLEVDCRNCLYIGTKIAHNFEKNFFKKTLRTSVDTIVRKFSDTENTSHIFWEFIEWNSLLKKKNYILFINSKNFANKDFFKNFHQEKNMQKNSKHLYHHIGTGWNAVFVSNNYDSYEWKKIFFENNFQILWEKQNIALSWQADFSDNVLYVNKQNFSKNFELSENILACEVDEETFECEKIFLK